MLLLHFLRLVRFGNLMVIGVTMCIIQAFIATHGNSTSDSNVRLIDPLVDGQHVPGISFRVIDSEGSKSFFEVLNFDLNFLLLILSTILIAGAGNIINDYFDIKADRINKPDKMVVEKHIKRRWAIMWNWIFNAIGMTIAIYLSWYNANWWIAGIAFVTINFLWFYSAVYKRKIFVGNALIAFLVGIVPIYVLVYNAPLQGFTIPFQDTFIDLGSLFVTKVVVIIAFIAFLINLMREIIKDMADIKGDLHLDARTVPIGLGIRRTKIILTLILIPLLVLIAFFIYDVTHITSAFENLSWNDKLVDVPEPFENLPWFVGFVLMSGLICVIAFGFLLTSNTRKKYLLSSNLLKLAMLFGMVSPLFL